jgi:hypothetical protein
LCRKHQRYTEQPQKNGNLFQPADFV